MKYLACKQHFFAITSDDLYVILARITFKLTISPINVMLKEFDLFANVSTLQRWWVHIKPVLILKAYRLSELNFFLLKVANIQCFILIAGEIFHNIIRK